MNKLTKLAVITLGLSLAACSDGPENSSGITEIPKLEKLELTPVETTLNQNMNDAAFELLNCMARNYNDIADETHKENLTVSPLSISLAMAMTANTVNGTEDGICNLYNAESTQELTTLANKLMRYMASENMRMANSVWYADKHTIDADYIKFMNSNFYADVNPVDFQSTDGVNMINSWVKTKTNNMIDRILDGPQMFDAMILNAIYFDGKWAEPFDPKQTRPETFHGKAGDTTVPMMSGTKGILYGENDNFEVAVLNLKGDYAITLAIPTKTTALEAAKTIKVSDLDINVGDERYFVKIPKFKVQQDFIITQILRMLGVEVTGRLDKMGLPLEAFYEIRHKTALEIDEEGTKAAAVTGVPVVTAPGPGGMLEVNRPFLFFIQNTTSGSTILCGCINNID